MSLWSRITNVFRPDRLSGEIDEELQAHIDEAVARGRDPVEARRAFGSVLKQRQESRDMRLIPWLDSLRADAVFGWRQLAKRKVTSAAAILSLALTIGACTSAFRLIDALLLRPLPVAHPEELYDLSRQAIDPEGKPQIADSWAYPVVEQMRAVAKGQAELMAVSSSELTELTWGSAPEMEKAYLQYVSGRMFSSFGLKPALGRLLTDRDDQTPGAHPVAVLSHDYWVHRFARDPNVIGRTFRMNDRIYQIVGVIEPPFTGTETGTVTDVFLPMMMHPWVTRSDATSARIIARLKPGVVIEPLRQKLEATFQAFERERVKGFTGMSQPSIHEFWDLTLLLESAAAGASGMQRDFRLPLAALAMLVAMVLLIACANVANLMTAQAAARGREMAVRVSIGAGRWRLVQLVLVESAILAFFAAVAGAAFAWWSAPFVLARINPPDNPARLYLPADWRVLGFGLLLTAGVTFLFGLAPALRASAIKPASALKGGESPHSRGRLLHGLIAVQVAFCFLVLFGANLFVATFDRLTNLSTGFSSDRLLAVDAVAAHPQPSVYWDQVAEHLRTLPGVESVAIADWALLSGYARNNFVSINGAPPNEELTYFRYISPGWLDTMKVPLIDGRDFRAGDTAPTGPASELGVAIVNEAFAKTFFDGKSPVGAWFERSGWSTRYRIVGLVRDVRYRNMRDPMLPLAFVPFRATDSNGAPRAIGEGTFMVRTRASSPLALASTVRLEIPRARPEFRVTNIRTQQQIDSRHTIRERLLALLGVFFAGVALLLSGIGLYGVLDYSVLQRRREIGIRLAIGAHAGDIARRVTAEVFAMVALGTIAGLGMGIATARYVESLLYGVRATDPSMLVLPFVIIVAATLMASLPAVIRAVRIDPVAMLRAD